MCFQIIILVYCLLFSCILVVLVKLKCKLFAYKVLISLVSSLISAYWLVQGLSTKTLIKPTDRVGLIY